MKRLKNSYRKGREASLVKRGRGAVGARMDETGSYLPDNQLDSKRKLPASPNFRVGEEWEHCVLRHEKAPSLKFKKYFEDEFDDEEQRKLKKVLVSEKHSTTHKKKERDGRHKKRKEKKI